MPSTIFFEASRFREVLMYSARDHASRDRIRGRGGDAGGEAGYDAIQARVRARGAFSCSRWVRSRNPMRVPSARTETVRRVEKEKLFKRNSTTCCMDARIHAHSTRTRMQACIRTRVTARRARAHRLVRFFAVPEWHLRRNFRVGRHLLYEIGVTRKLRFLSTAVSFQLSLRDTKMKTGAIFNFSSRRHLRGHE